MEQFSIGDRIFRIEYLKKEHSIDNYLNLLKQLSILDPITISKNVFDNFIDNLNDNHIVIVMVDVNLNIIIGSTTIFKEQKLIHNMGKVAHIEDVIIDKNYRGYGLGKKMIETANSISKECYKISLNCSSENVGFYQQLKFKLKENQMVIYN